MNNNFENQNQMPKYFAEPTGQEEENNQPNNIPPEAHQNVNANTANPYNNVYNYYNGQNQVYGNVNQPTPNNPYFVPGVPYEQPSKFKLGDAIKTLIFGIISLQFAFTPFLSIASIVFGAIAKSTGKKIVAENCGNKAMLGLAKAGRITGLIGFIIGIVMTSVYSLALFS